MMKRAAMVFVLGVTLGATAAAQDIVRLDRVATWESGPGVLRSDGYPHDEYCRVLEGHLIVTDESGQRDEFDPGDAFVIPKGWKGTWNMTTRFKKQYVALEQGR